MKVLGKIAFLAALVGAVSPSMAGGSLKDAPASAPFSWTGYYLGVQAGYLNGDASHTFSNGAPSDSSDPSGIVAGGHIGYNFQSGSVVFGLEADLEKSGADGSFSNSTGITSQGASSLDWQGSLRGRLGVTSGNALFYLTAGWAFGGFDFKGGPVGGPVCCGYSQNLNGWTVGGGGELAVAKNFTVRAEYRYTDYGQASGGLPPTFPTVIMPVDVTTHVFRLGASVKF